MINKNKILEVRMGMGIPENGLPSEEEALVWFKDHYCRVKNKEFSGNFGFEYDRLSGYIYFKYELQKDYFKILVPSPLDNEVPLDREATLLAHLEEIPDWAAPWFRLLILIGEAPEMIEVQAPEHLIAPAGPFRLIF